MDMNYITILTHLGTLALGSIITVFVLYKFFNANKLLMRKPPLGIVSDGLKWLYVRFRPRKWIYNYWQVPHKIFWYDWHRGFGYGYMDEEEMPRPGDVIQVKLKSNNPKLRGKVMQLFFYYIYVPDDSIPDFFVFKTIFGGIKSEQKPETDEELAGRFRGFQRLI